MSFKKTWVLTCDMRECRNAYYGLPVPQKDQTLAAACAVGWGKANIGKFGLAIFLCPKCRKELQKTINPYKFREPITNRHYRGPNNDSPQETILLDCGHEFTSLLSGDYGDETASCPACELEWRRSGRIEELPELEDLLPEVIE